MTALRTVLTILLAWGFVTGIIVTSDWLQTSYPHFYNHSGYWVSMAAVGVVLVYGTAALMLGVMIWTVGRKQ